MSRRIAALLIAICFVGASLSYIVYRLAKQADEARVVTEFNRRADGRSAFIHEVLNNYQSGIYALKTLFDGSDEVSREEFRFTSDDSLARYPGISALEWAPLVTANKRAEVEEQLSRELHREFRITERNSNGAMVPAGERTEYCPIVFLEPLSGNERAFGYDVLAAPSRPFLDRARATGQFVVSAQFDLVQSDRGVVMAWPVFHPPDQNGRRNFRGFVQGIFRVQKIFEHSFTRSPSSSFDVLFLDASAEGNEDRIMYYRPAQGPSPTDLSGVEAEFRAGIYRETSLDLGGRRWIALYRPSRSWLDEQQSIHPQLWLISGLVITGLVSALIGVLTRRTAAIAREVALRTAELSESRRQLAHVLHALPGMAYRCSYDEEMTVLYVSEGAFALTGYRPDEFVSGQIHFRTLIHPDDLQRVRLLTRAALDSRNPIEVEYRIRPRTGTEKWVLSRARGVESDGSHHAQFIEGLAIDITARKQAEFEKIAIERRLLESQKLESLGLLAGGIAHDFNNLLTGILGNASLARYTQKLDSATGDYLAKIESGANRAAELCQQMLAYSGRGRFVIEPVDLDRLIESTLPLLRPSLPERAHLELKLSGQRPTVMGDATQLRQILMNLILNAADALGATGGRIEIGTATRWLGPDFFTSARTGEDLNPGNYVVLEVTDTGCGMSTETLAKIFDPFFTTKFTGRGLGLAAVLGIVRGHHGAMHVRSALGLGTTFSLALPPCRQEANIVSNEPRPNEGWRHSGRILIIDDEPPVRNVAAELVRTFGMDPTTAMDGYEGVELFEKQGNFDVVFLDLTMPGLSGSETLVKLRAINPQVRVLLVSGFSDLERVAQLASGGPLVFMQKPFTRADFEAKLRELLG